MRGACRRRSVPSTLLCTACQAFSLFHQRHVLVGGGVEDDRGPVIAPAPASTRRGVLDVADARTTSSPGNALVPNSCSMRYSANSVCSNSTSRAGPKRAIWRHSSDADRAAGAGDQHDAAGEQSAQSGAVERHRVAAEQVVELDVAQLRDGDACRSPGRRSDGTVSTCSPAARTARRARRLRRALASGMAMIACSTPSLRCHVPAVRRAAPRTCTPWICAAAACARRRRAGRRRAIAGCARGPSAG